MFGSNRIRQTSAKSGETMAQMSDYCQSLSTHIHTGQGKQNQLHFEGFFFFVRRIQFTWIETTLGLFHLHLCDYRGTNVVYM